MNRLLFLVILVLADSAAAQRASVAPAVTPAPVGSAQGHLARGDDGRVRLSWVQREGPAAVLRFSTLDGVAWSAPKTIASGDRWFVNWADVPSLAADGKGALAAHWLDRLGEGAYAYGIRVSTSTDGGVRWSPPKWLHDDTSPQEHGFCTLRALEPGRFQAVWLDGRGLGEPGREMQLRTRAFGVTGTFGAEELLDPRVCECCPTALVRVEGRGFLCAYRDRTGSEVRDISWVRGASARPIQWGSPRPVSIDGWERPG